MDFILNNIETINWNRTSVLTMTTNVTTMELEENTSTTGSAAGVAVAGGKGGEGGTMSDVPPLINEAAMYWLRLTMWSLACNAISVLGVITNTINIIVFVKTGFKDTITISLFALAISDFGQCFTLIFSNNVMNPWFQDAVDDPIAWDDVQYVVSAWPHVTFSKVTTLITAFITVERCLCVSMPLKVKLIVTRGRVIAFLVSCYVFVLAIMIPMFYSNRVGWVFYPRENKTMFGIVFTENRKDIENVVYPINNAFLSMFAFIFIIIATTILVVELNKKSKWRMKATVAKTGDDSNNNSNNMSTKEQKIARMVVSISTLFIVLLFPMVAMQLVMWIDRRINVDGVYSNLNFTIAFGAATVENVNASMNIFIYYRNSSNYKEVFDRVFKSKKGNTT